MREGVEKGGEGQEDDRSDQPAPGSAAEKLLSILYAFLVNDFSSTPLYTFLRHQLEALDQAAARDHPASSSDNPPSPPPRTTQITLLLAQRADSIQDLGGEAAELAEVVPLMLDLQSQLDGEKDRDLRAMVLCTLQQLATSSRRSQVALSEAGVVGMGLERLFPLKSPPQEREETAEAATAVEGEEREVWTALVERLLELGADTSETRRLFKSAVDNSGTDGQEKLNEEVLELM